MPTWHAGPTCQSTSLLIPSMTCGAHLSPLSPPACAPRSSAATPASHPVRSSSSLPASRRSAPNGGASSPWPLHLPTARLNPAAGRSASHRLRLDPAPAPAVGLASASGRRPHSHALSASVRRRLVPATAPRSRRPMVAARASLRAWGPTCHLSPWDPFPLPLPLPASWLSSPWSLGAASAAELSLRPPRLPVPQAAASTCASGCHAEAPI